MKQVAPELIKWLWFDIVPDESLIGDTNGYQLNETIFVSPAIFELLLDDESKEQIMTDVKIISMADELEELLMRYTV